MGIQVTYAENLPEIPSEFIERYAQRFLMMQIESVAFGLITPERARTYIQGAEFFLTTFSGIHARYAVNNSYYRFTSLSDADMISVCKQTFKEIL